ncbi:MAG: YebC/PmpR family DNA-binding transcriptional regulator [Oscillospiraceae bacterium]
MSGHSKWHNIQKTKGAQDAKRAAAFTKISKEMIVAVKEGGGIADPAYNSRLATVITKAKAANMPNDNIKRVLEKAAASGSGDNYETITYEGHGPCGVAVIVETMTDNRNRTAGSVRHHFDKYGGSLGTNGCVSWSFDRKGVIVIDNEDEELDEDTVMMDALDAGAADFQPEEGCFTVYTSPDDINTVAKALEDKATSSTPPRSRWSRSPTRSSTSRKTATTWKKMLDLFEEDDDVQNVWHNWDQE